MFEWDEAKNRSNLVKHGLDFGDAEKVFAGPSITFVDDRFDYGEERLIHPGRVGRPRRGYRPRAAWRGHADYLHEKGKPP